MGRYPRSHRVLEVIEVIEVIGDDSSFAATLPLTLTCRPHRLPLMAGHTGRDGWSHVVAQQRPDLLNEALARGRVFVQSRRTMWNAVRLR